VSQNHFLATYQ